MIRQTGTESTAPSSLLWCMFRQRLAPRLTVQTTGWYAEPSYLGCKCPPGLQYEKGPTLCGMIPTPGGYSLMSTWFGPLCGLPEKMVDPDPDVTGMDLRRDTMGSVNQSGSGASMSLSFTRSEGHVWSLRCTSCFQRGLGADVILSKIWDSSSSERKLAT